MSDNFDQENNDSSCVDSKDNEGTTAFVDVIKILGGTWGEHNRFAIDQE